jgi:Telomere length regulation protein.
MGTLIQEQDSHSFSSVVAVSPCLKMPEENSENLDYFAKEVKISHRNSMEQNTDSRETSTVTNSVTVKCKISEVVSSFIALKLPDKSGSWKSLIKSLADFLPGPFTPQKFCGVDVLSSDLAQFYEFHYSQILEIILEQYSPEWIDMEAEVLISKLMVIDGSGVILLYETLQVLTRALRESKGPCQKLDFIIDTLEKVVRSGAFFSAVLDQCSVRNINDERKLSVMIAQDHVDQIWEGVVQLMMSLPSRVSNKMKHATKNTFAPNLYCKILCCHIAKCVQFLSEAVCDECLPLKLQGLSVFLSKLIIHFNDGRKSAGILTLIQIFEQWCSSPSYHTVVQNIFLNLHLEAIETIAKMILEKCSNPSAVYNILGNTVCHSQTWKHVLCTKMLLMSYCDWVDSTLIENLIGYLAYMHFENLSTKVCAESVSVIPNGGMLIDVLDSLLTVWGDRSALNHTPLDQHIYISQAVILCVQYFQASYHTVLKESEQSHEVQALNDGNRKIIENKLFSGIPVHLESPLESVRVTGMVTAEMLTSILHRGDEPKLKFDYEGLSKEADRILKALKKLSPREIKFEVKDKQDVQDRAYCIMQMQSNSIILGNELLQHLEFDCGLTLAIADSRDLNITDSVKVDRYDEMNAGKLVDVTGDVEQIRQFDSDDCLDSDDDLIPYDMSDDVKLSTKKRPKYLRDLRDGLLETEDHERFGESLEVCEALIMAQLPDDDVSLGIELLEILVCLEEKFFVDSFDTHRYSASVAVVSTFPQPCAEYLSSQFNTGFGKYSIGQRLFMLDCLAGTAKKLSNLQTSLADLVDVKGTSHTKFGTSKKFDIWNTNKDTVSNTALVSAKDIVQKRIESHTRRFISAPKPVPVGQVNKFSAVAGSFFFPLLCGIDPSSGRSSLFSSSYADCDCVLLVHFLHTLAVIMASSINCPSSVRMGKELLDLCWTLRYHSQAKVRLAVMGCVGAVVIALPDSRLISDLYESLLECRLWLLEVMKTGLRQGDPDSGCREFAAYVLALIENVIGESLVGTWFC